MSPSKEQLLEELQSALSRGELTPDELKKLTQKKSFDPSSKPNFIKLGYYLGGLIIFLGLFFLINDFWFRFNNTTHILIAAGVPLMSYVCASLLMDDNQWSVAATPFFLLFSLLLPIAFYISFTETHYYIPGWFCEILLMLCTISAVWAFLLYRRLLLLVFSFIYGSLCYLALLAHWLYLIPDDWKTRYGLIGIFFMGAFYSFICYPCWIQHRPWFAKILLYFGFYTMLSAALALKSQWVHGHGVWEIIAAAVIFFDFYCAVKWRETFLLFLGALYLIFDINMITSDYFSGSLGWIASLLIGGGSLIAAANLSLFLYNRHFKR